MNEMRRGANAVKRGFNGRGVSDSAPCRTSIFFFREKRGERASRFISQMALPAIPCPSPGFFAAFLATSLDVPAPGPNPEKKLLDLVQSDGKVRDKLIRMAPTVEEPGCTSSRVFPYIAISLAHEKLLPFMGARSAKGRTRIVRCTPPAFSLPPYAGLFMRAHFPSPPPPRLASMVPADLLGALDSLFADGRINLPVFPNCTPSGNQETPVKDLVRSLVDAKDSKGEHWLLRRARAVWRTAFGKFLCANPKVLEFALQEWMVHSKTLQATADYYLGSPKELALASRIRVEEGIVLYLETNL